MPECLISCPFSMKIGGGKPYIGLANGGGGTECVMSRGGECIALFPVVDAGEDPSDGLHIRRSCAFGVVACCRIVCDVTVAEHFDERRFRRFILVFLRSFFVSEDFIFSSEPFGFISFAVGAIVIKGSGDFLCSFGGSGFSVGFVMVVFSGLGDADFSDAGDVDRLLQFFNQRSGVIRLEVDEAFTRCGLRSR